MSENGEIYTAGKIFTLPPAVTAVSNPTSGYNHPHLHHLVVSPSALPRPLFGLRRMPLVVADASTVHYQ